MHAGDIMRDAPIIETNASVFNATLPEVGDAHNKHYAFQEVSLGLGPL